MASERRVGPPPSLALQRALLRLLGSEEQRASDAVDALFREHSPEAIGSGLRWLAGITSALRPIVRRMNRKRGHPANEVDLSAAVVVLTGRSGTPWQTLLLEASRDTRFTRRHRSRLASAAIPNRKKAGRAPVTTEGDLMAMLRLMSEDPSLKPTTAARRVLKLLPQSAGGPVPNGLRSLLKRYKGRRSPLPEPGSQSN